MSTEGVTFTVKELLSKLEDALTQGFASIDHRLEGIDRKLDDKASNARMRELEQVFERFKGHVEDRFRPLEAAAIGSAAVSKARRRIENALVAIAASAVGTLIYIVATGGH